MKPAPAVQGSPASTALGPGLIFSGELRLQACGTSQKTEMKVVSPSLAAITDNTFQRKMQPVLFQREKLETNQHSAVFTEEISNNHLSAKMD